MLDLMIDRLLWLLFVLVCHEWKWMMFVLLEKSVFHSFSHYRGLIDEYCMLNVYQNSSFQNPSSPPAGFEVINLAMSSSCRIWKTGIRTSLLWVQTSFLMRSTLPHISPLLVSSYADWRLSFYVSTTCIVIQSIGHVHRNFEVKKVK